MCTSMQTVKQKSLEVLMKLVLYYPGHSLKQWEKTKKKNTLHFVLTSHLIIYYHDFFPFWFKIDVKKLKTKTQTWEFQAN